MNLTWIGSAFILGTLAFACGGGSGGGGGIGVSGSKTLGELNADEARNVCEYLADSIGPARTITCPDGSTMTVEAQTEADIAECATQLEMVDAACTVTVAQAQDCFDDIDALTDDQLCMDAPPPASCDPLFNSQVCGGG